MTVDLEDRLRDALRRQADEVTPARLRFADGPQSIPRRRTHRGRTAWLAPAAVAACVAAFAVTVAVMAGGGHTSSPAGGSGPAAVAALAGTAWRLDSVRKPDGSTIAVPDRLSAGIAFERDHKTLGADDGINYATAGYTVTSTGDLLVTAGGTTYALYGGHDPAVLAAQDAVRAIVYGQVGETAAHTVAVEVQPRLLRLSAEGFVLTFVDELPLATSAPATSAPTTGLPGTSSPIASRHT